MSKISRRSILVASGALGATALAPVAVATAVAGSASKTYPRATRAKNEPAPPATYLFFNAEEAAFIEAAVARLIPADDQWPGALEAGVPNYIDKQLAGAWGSGERLYRSGPWASGTPSQGYQLPFTPAELFHKALAAIHKEAGGASFAKTTPARQDEFLKRLESGGKDLGGVPSEVFFEHLWKSTVEGFFSDPVYGGNHEMVSWQMIGFPGAYASYYDLVDQHGITINRPPMSLAESSDGHIHMEPDIPAQVP
jgi:gluconate 2-dehydrogenase gamma chain